MSESCSTVWIFSRGVEMCRSANRILTCSVLSLLSSELLSTLSLHELMPGGVCHHLPPQPTSSTSYPHHHFISACSPLIAFSSTSTFFLSFVSLFSTSPSPLLQLFPHSPLLPPLLLPSTPVLLPHLFYSSTSPLVSFSTFPLHFPSFLSPNPPFYPPNSYCPAAFLLICTSPYPLLHLFFLPFLLRPLSTRPQILILFSSSSSSPLLRLSRFAQDLNFRLLPPNRL